MPEIADQRCFNHRHRESAARCPGCGRFFCRECITEHADRVLCASCLQRQLKPVRLKSSPAQWLLHLGQLTLGLVLLYVLFYYLGRLLLEIPTAFHDGTLWQSIWWKGT